MFPYKNNLWRIFEIVLNVVACLVVSCILGDVALAQTIMVSRRVTTEYDGPNIHISCSVSNIPQGHTDPTVAWQFEGKTLSENTELIDADPLRFSVSDGGLKLSLRNALKKDEGTYTCKFSYMLSSGNEERINVDKSHWVAVASYVPPLNYPICSIDTTVITVGTNVTFICKPGDSNPKVNLQLILEKNDQSHLQLGNSTTSKIITVDDNDSVFICKMTSDTFPTVRRNCSAGPIKVVSTTPPTPTSVPTTPMKATTAATTMSTTAKKSTTEKSSTTNPIPSPEISETALSERSGVTPINTTPGIYTSKSLSPSNTSFSTMQATREASVTMPWSIIGGSAGAALVILIIIIIVLVFVKQRSSKETRKPNERSQDISEMTDVRKGSALDNAYSSEVIGNGTPFDQPSTSADRNSDDDNCDVKPVYGVVNKSNKVDRVISESKPVYAAVDKKSKSNPRHDEEMPVYESTEIEAAQSNKPATSSDLPVYGKVNKGFKKDPKDESSKRESSGFVDNIIYTPSGPFVNQK